MNKFCLVILFLFTTNCLAFWTPVPGKFQKISGAKDGTVMALDHHQRVWLRLGEKWKMIPGKLKSISIGSVDFILGLDVTGQMWKFDFKNKKWNKLKGHAKDASVGDDGSVYIISENDEVLSLKNQNWVSENIRLSKVVVVNKDHIWGIALNGKVVQKIDGIWEDLPGKLIDLDASSDKSAIGIKPNKTFWIWDGSKWRRIMGRLNQITLSGKRNIWGLNSKGQLYHGLIPKPKCPKGKCKEIKKADEYRITNLLANAHLSKLKTKAVLLGYRGWDKKWKALQAWQLEENTSGLFKIKNGSGLCLEAHNLAEEVNIRPCSDKDDQLWKISGDKNNTSLENYRNQRCLGVVAPNQPVKLIDCEKDERHFWKLTKI